MNYLNTHLLSLILFLPTIAALIMLFLPGGETKLLRWFALSASLIPFVLTLVLWGQFPIGCRRFPIPGNLSLV
jgi:NADH-quinone oxidoreductase subunit M